MRFGGKHVLIVAETLVMLVKRKVCEDGLKSRLGRRGDLYCER